MSYFKSLLTIGVLLVTATVSSFALKAEYRFETCSGEPTTKNYQGTGLDGNLSGDAKVTLNDGQIKNALTFDGNGAMSVEHDSNLDLVENLTISFWVNPSQIKRQALISRGDGSGDDRKYGSNAEYSLVLWEDGKFKYKHNGVADTFSNSTIALNQWTHIVLVRDNSAKSIKIYVNGVLDANSSYTLDPVSSSSEKLLIGTGEYYSDTMNNFKGKLDEIKIYNLALSQNDISNMYNTEKEGTHLTGGCQAAPEAVNDSADLPYAGSVNNVDILTNDRANDSDICSVDATTVQIVSFFDGSTLSDDNKTLTVSNEGVWHVDNNGLLSFVSNNNFLENPTPIEYTVSDNCGNISNSATVSLTRVNDGSNFDDNNSSDNNSSDNNSSDNNLDDNSSNNNITTFGIGDRVWYDANHNGLQDSGEMGVANVIVVLYDDNGNVVSRTTTDSNGEYHFSNLLSGNYSLGFMSLPTNYIFTTQNVGNNDEIDSDVDNSGRTSLINIGGGDVANDLTCDVGIVPTEEDSSNGIADNNSSSIVNADCDCEPYESTIPSLNIFGIVFISILMSILALLFVREEELNLN
ncbi:MAG: hypothetical protein GXO60_06035 [Epsilonproteobacteria bacterium]|nr:hypothetical protein [Campylobacterota bacterium]